MLDQIPTDIVTYVIAPYLYVPVAIIVAGYGAIQPPRLLHRACYKQPHGIITKSDGIYHFRHGKLHRDDGPAKEYTNGDLVWCQCGKVHRDGGPAKLYTNGNKSWWNHGKRHRDGGPAKEYNNGSKEWYQYSKLHRADGPAKELSNGYRAWYQHGKLHRIYGPAEERADGTEGWWLDGIPVGAPAPLRRSSFCSD